MVEAQEDVLKFAQLYTEYKGLMYVATYSMLHDIQLTEDVVWSAFCHAALDIQHIEAPVCEETKDYLLDLCELYASRV